MRYLFWNHPRLLLKMHIPGPTDLLSQNLSSQVIETGKETSQRSCMLIKVERLLKLAMTQRSCPLANLLHLLWLELRKHLRIIT